MTSIKKQFISALAIGTLLLQVAAPVFAESTNVEISNNGAGAVDTVGVTTTQSNSVVQNNNATVTNNITVTSNTGKNTADFNTGGAVTVATGQANSDVTVDNAINKNVATTGCCDANRTANVIISGNGATSTNGVGLNSTDTNAINQTNVGSVSNNVSTTGNTGQNSATFNTNGSVTVVTGKAKADVSVSTDLNANVAQGGNGAPAGNSTMTLAILDNGASSLNAIGATLTRTNSVFQNNNGTVRNTISATGETGKNNAGFNTGGNVAVVTGDANTTVDVDNHVNFNRAALDCCVLGGDVLAKIAGNGALSQNNIGLILTQNDQTSQDNLAYVSNDLNVLGETGLNDASFNTGGAVLIATGNANTNVDLANHLNFNSADSNCCVLGDDLIGRILDNGALSHNNIALSFVQNNSGKNGLWQTNLLSLANCLNALNGNTGSNTANFNGGGVAHSDPAVLTGDANTNVGVDNHVNENVDGPSPIVWPAWDWGNVTVTFSLADLAHLLHV